MNRLITLCASLLLLILSAVAANPKREFRGAWLNTIYRQEYHNLGTAKCKAYLSDQLDRLQQAGVNAVFFQVRPQADALYDSKLEPWSRFLTDNGQPPKPYWDPLEFMVTEAHRRGMELHAWLNPYRVTSAANQKLPPKHLYHKHPERFIKYEGKLYFDPALDENRRHIVDVVTDIVSRYDVDGIHFDDYFYPYPGKTAFPDQVSYKKYGSGMTLDDWRRHNIDLLIEQVSAAVHTAKPWVRFGISPFGIWRNASSDPRGSQTSGLENYDALYADVLLWAEKGWVDYLLPQLYWEVGHKRADYATLVQWWNDHTTGCHLYIGQDVNRCMDQADHRSGKGDQLDFKIESTRSLDNISGLCWWPAYSVTGNYKGVADRLKSSHHNTLALPPAYTTVSTDRPMAPQSLRVAGKRLSWKAADCHNQSSDVVRYVVYRFDKKAKIDLDDPAAIVAVVDTNTFTAKTPGKYVVTALDRVNNESLASKSVTVK